MPKAKTKQSILGVADAKRGCVTIDWLGTARLNTANNQQNSVTKKRRSYRWRSSAQRTRSIRHKIRHCLNRVFYSYWDYPFSLTWHVEQRSFCGNYGLGWHNYGDFDLSKNLRVVGANGKNQAWERYTWKQLRLWLSITRFLKKREGSLWQKAN